MEAYFQAAAAVLLTVILSLTLSGQAKTTAGILVILVGCMVLGVAFSYIKTILSFLEELKTLGNISSDITLTMCKCAGISILSELVSMVCSDSGNATLGKALQILSSAVILYLSLPMFQALLELVQIILEAV